MLIDRFMSTVALTLLLTLVSPTQIVSADIAGEWFARYDGQSTVDGLGGLTVDSDGNVYVTGSSRENATTGYDYVTTKYASGGNQLWQVRYNGPADGDDSTAGRDPVVDGSGNVYVTGCSDGTGGVDIGYDIATVKYDSDGNQLWVARYNGPADQDDMGSDLAVDSAGNVYVAGYMYLDVDRAKCDFVTIKYDMNGNEVWVMHYDGPANASHDLDRLKKVAVDGSGNVYVTGYIFTFPDNNSDFATIKYAPDGNQLWVATYEGPAFSHDRASDLAIDVTGNVYVAGYSHGNGTSSDFATIKYDTDGNELWVARYDNPGNGSDEPVAMGLDAQGNVYVIGKSNGITLQATAIKYDPNGNQVWIASSQDNCYAYDGTVDSAGNVFMVGYIPFFYGDPLDETLLFAVKFDHNGNEVWNITTNNHGGKYQEVASDDEGNVYVSASIGNDVLTLKFNLSASGPVVDFSATPTSGSVPLTVDFSDLTTGSVDSWKWDFNGDYLVDSTEQNPSFTYNAANHVVTLLASGPEGKGFLIKDNYLSVTGDYVGPRVYKIRGHKEPGRRIRIIGSGFGDIQGDSVVYIGKKAFDSSSRRIKLWTDTKIIVKLPNYRCKRFKRDFRLFGVRVTDGFYTSAFTNFKVLKPGTCP